MSNGISTIKPGLLVSLKTEMVGGAQYTRIDLESKNKGKAEVHKWETTKVVENPTEYQEAKVARGLASTAIRRTCIKTSFGLLCPTENEAALDAGVKAARVIIDKFNVTATRTQIAVFVLKGRIAATDEEATKAIMSEVRGLLTGMESGVLGADVKVIRDAANRARALGAMLDQSKAAKVSEAVKAARDAAREIAKRVTKGGETVQTVLGEVSSAAVEKIRFSFLDFDSQGTAEGKAIPAVNVKRFAEVQ
jgi:hypothetical protein